MKLILTIVTSLLLLGCASLKTEPTDKPEVLSPHAAAIINMNRNSGGSGSVIQTDSRGTVILTNKHVCEVIQAGGYVETDDAIGMIVAYKLYDKHDLCMVKVLKKMGTAAKLADGPPEAYSQAYIAGHPSLLPTVISSGHVSHREMITVMMGFKPCDENTPEKYAPYCFFMGGYPILKTFEAELSSPLIAPGSSGSGVYNKDGEIIAVAFASNSRDLAYAYTVPFEYVQDFIKNNRKYEWIAPSAQGSGKASFFEDGTTKLRSMCKSPEKQLRKFCSRVAQPLLWIK